MKVHIVGGGPAGLYFAILMKKAWPDAEITVFERNRADDTFGFGVVFSDETLDTFEALRPRELSRRSPAISPTGTTSRSTSRARCTASAATASAAARARPCCRCCSERAPRARRRARVRDRGRPTSRRMRDADLVVAADGINSRDPRDARASTSSPTIDLRPNKFAWLGSTRPFDAFTFFFRETEHGIFIAHCYQYEPGRSTWVMETDPETFARAGLDKLDEAAVGALPRRRVRATSLRGHALHHQPLAVAQLPDDPQRALGQGQHRADRRRQGDRAFLDRLGHQARDGGRDRALRGVPRDRRARRRARRSRITKRRAARRSRRPSTPPTCRWSGSSTSSASGRWTRRASRSA